MNRNIALTVIILMFFSSWLNSAIAYASSSEAPAGCSKSFVASSKTIQVPDNYETIQEAINNADEGDTVFVRAGTYYENVRIDKSLTLVGENRSTTVIDGDRTGIVVYVTANNITLSGFTIQNGALGILLSFSNNNTLAGNIASNNRYGIYLLWSRNSTLAGNIALDNEYGIYLSWSRDNTLAGNIASNNEYGIHIDGSRYNTLAGNNVSANDNSGIFLHHSGNNVLSGNIASNNQYGIHLKDSDNNVLSGNIALDNEYGIYLYYSRDNVVTGITASNNEHGVYLYYSHDNTLAGNIASNNEHGIYFYYSRDNVVTGITASNNRYGIWFTSSGDNIIYHNNFIENTAPARGINSPNSWDNGVEGNYWSDYDGDDANWDGIGDRPYAIFINNKDNYPLMARILRFTIAAENQFYKIDVVSSSTVSNLQCCYDPGNKISGVGFGVNEVEGKGFCRISICNALVEPPYTVTVDQNSPSYSEIVYKNRTHSWLYFTYAPLEHEITIVHTPYPEQLVLSRWAILGLSAIIVVLLVINIRYYRMFKEQKKVVQAYERELGSFPASHSERARLLFVKDVIERKEKIGRFRKKYGIKIQPASTLEDLMEKMGVKKES